MTTTGNENSTVKKKKKKEITKKKQAEKRKEEKECMRIYSTHENHENGRSVYSRGVVKAECTYYFCVVVVVVFLFGVWIVLFIFFFSFISTVHFVCAFVFPFDILHISIEKVARALIHTLTDLMSIRAQ